MKTYTRAFVGWNDEVKAGDPANPSLTVGDVTVFFDDERDVVRTIAVLLELRDAMRSVPAYAGATEGRAQ